MKKQQEKYVSRGTSIEEILKLPIIFVSGSPGSGTTLMRAILDVSPRINCGHESQIIPSFLGYITNNQYLKNNNKFFQQYKQSLKKAMGYFIGELIRKNNDSFDILCNKDPGNSYHIPLLHEIFPTAKFILMVRDGRGMAMSNIKRVKIAVNTNNFYKYLFDWDKNNRISYNNCMKVGEKVCKLVKYEDLVSKPEEKIREILMFLDIPFSKDFLRHNELAKYTRRNETFIEVRKEINTDRLNSWVGKVKYDKMYVFLNIKMLHVHGYRVDFDNEEDGKIVETVENLN